MKTRVITLSLLAGIVAVCFPMFAHHGNAAYPHSIITFEAKDANGKVAKWAGELGSPSALGNLGWTKVSVQTGDVITVYIHQSKTGNPVGRITRIVLPDGSSLRDSGGGGEDNPAGGRR